MNDKRIKGIVLFGVITIAVLTAFWGIDGRAIGNHEAYVGVTARQMLKTGDLVMPYFNGEPRLQKTPLCYWLVAGAGKAAGKINDFAVRLPSAALTVLSAIAVFYFVCERLGFNIAILSTFVWATTLCYMRYSHTGRPEMALSVFVTIAMLSFYSGMKTESRKKQIYYFLIFWVSFALAMLAKGPAPLPVMIPALFLYFLIFKQWKKIPKLLPIAGTIIFLLIVLPWPIAVLAKYPQAAEIWQREFLGRAEGEYASGGKPFYYYFEVMFVLFIPYCAFIVLAFFMPFYKVWQEKRDAIWYHWLWFFAGVLTMSACGGKRQHYILPVIAAMAALAGIVLNDMIFERKIYERKFVRNFVIGHIIAVIAVLGVIVSGKLNFQSKEDDENYVTYKLVEQVAAEANEVFAYCNVNASFVYYFGKDVPEICDVNEIYGLYEKGYGIFAEEGYYEQLKKDSRFNLYIQGLDNERGFFIIKK